MLFLCNPVICISMTKGFLSFSFFNDTQCVLRQRDSTFIDSRIYSNRESISGVTMRKIQLYSSEHVTIYINLSRFNPSNNPVTGTCTPFSFYSNNPKQLNRMSFALSMYEFQLRRLLPIKTEIVDEKKIEFPVVHSDYITMFYVFYRNVSSTTFPSNHQFIRITFTRKCLK